MNDIGTLTLRIMALVIWMAVLLPISLIIGVCVAAILLAMCPIAAVLLALTAAKIVSWDSI